MNSDHRLTETITVKAQTGVGTHKDPLFGSASTLAARVEYGKARAFDHVEHDAVVYTTTEIVMSSRVWLPGDSTADDKLARRPKATKKTRSIDGSFTLFKTALGR